MKKDKGDYIANQEKFMKIIDFHNHLMRTDLDGTRLIKAMDENNVERTVVMGARETSMYSANSEAVARVFKKYPDRLIAGVYIDRPFDSEYAISRLRKYRELGFKIAKMFPVYGYYPDDPRLMPLYEEIAGSNMMVLYHMGGGNSALLTDGDRILIRKGKSGMSVKYGRPQYIDALGFMFPEIDFIMAHMGAPDYEEAVYMAGNHANVYLDCSSTCYRPVFKGLKIKEDYLLRSINFKKILWGLDGGPEHYTSRIKETQELMTELGWKQHIPDVFYNNADKLLMKYRCD